MNLPDLKIFELLKQKVSQTFLKENTVLSTDITQWKGDDIIKFQEDLLHKVKGRVSEKWFYNYFRNDLQKLPRIDMLNLLSEYVGEKSWADFKAKHAKEKKQLNFKKLSLMGIIPLLIFGFLYFKNNVKTVQFCFIDENSEIITDILTVTIKLENETDKILKTTIDNCIEFNTKNDIVEITIESPYHKIKTFKRQINESKYKENIVLETDIYALMLRHYSNSKTNDWKLRKEKLNNIIIDDALIYQRFYGDQKGVEIYSKEDFIFQLTVPTSLLKHLEILETEFENGKIKKLGFIITQ